MRGIAGFVVLTTVSYGNGDFVWKYLGVESDNAARSGLGQFGADSGPHDVRVLGLAIYTYGPQWQLAGGLIYSRLFGDASHSPVVDVRGSSDQVLAGLGIAEAG